MALPALVWVEIESSTMEIDGGLEMLDVAEATSRFFTHWIVALTASTPALVMPCCR